MLTDGWLCFGGPFLGSFTVTLIPHCPHWPHCGPQFVASFYCSWKFAQLRMKVCSNSISSEQCIIHVHTLLLGPSPTEKRDPQLWGDSDLPSKAISSICFYLLLLIADNAMVTCPFSMCVCVGIQGHRNGDPSRYCTFSSRMICTSFKSTVPANYAKWYNLIIIIFIY